MGVIWWKVWFDLWHNKMRTLLAVISIFATGPFGAAGALVFPLLARRNAASEALLPAWYERVALSAEQDTFTKLSDRVGRRKKHREAVEPAQSKRRCRAILPLVPRRGTHDRRVPLDRARSVSPR